jgi:predicted nicotinamide N-methyase
MVENPFPHAALIRARTGIGAGALCPEVALYPAPDLYALWDAQEQVIEKPGLLPPYWALAWAGRRFPITYSTTRRSLRTSACWT